MMLMRLLVILVRKSGTEEMKRTDRAYRATES